MKPVQTELFPNMPKPKDKPEHMFLEKSFMQDVMDYALKIGLSNLHVDYYCGNKFFVECPCCGNKTLAECHKSNNKENSGLPDIIGIAWGIELKRDRNQRGDAYEPSLRQKTQMEKLHDHGIPVIVGNPGNMVEIEKFLKSIHK